MSTPDGPLVKVLADRESVYLPDQASIGKAEAYSWSLLPENSASLLIQALRPLPADVQPGDRSSVEGDSGSQTEDTSEQVSRGFILLWSDRPRALSQRERLWAAAVAAKLQSVLL